MGAWLVVPFSNSCQMAVQLSGNASQIGPLRATASALVAPADSRGAGAAAAPGVPLVAAMTQGPPQC